MSCQAVGCVLPASSFSFQDSQQLLSCPQHLPCSGKSYPIRQLDFVKCPELESLCLEREVAAAQGLAHLEELQSALEAERQEVEREIEAVELTTIETVQEYFRAEKEKTEQHYTAISRTLRTFKYHLSLYPKYVVCDLSPVEKLLMRKPGYAPKLLRTQCFPASLALRDCVFRQPLELSQYLSRVLDEDDKFRYAEELLGPTNNVKVSIANAFLSHHILPLAATVDTINALTKELAAQTNIDTESSESLCDTPQLFTSAVQRPDLLLEAVLPASQPLFDAEHWLSCFRTLFPHSRCTASLAYRLAVQHFNQRNYSQAVLFLSMACEIYREVTPQGAELAETLATLGAAYRKLKRLPEAGHCYREAVLLYTQSGEVKLRAQALCALGELYQQLQQFDLATECCFSAVESFSSADHDLPKARLTLAKAFAAQGRSGEAEKQCIQALVQLDHSSAQSALVAQAHLLLAELQVVGHQAELAYITTADSLGRNFPTSMEAILAHCALGTFYRRNEKYKKAEKSYLMALLLLHCHYASNKQIALTYNDLAYVYEHTSQYSLAESCYSAAVRLQQTNFPTSKQTAETYNNFAYLYERTARYDQAALCYQTALALMRAHHPTSLRTAKFLVNFGYLYERSLHYAEAEEYYVQAIALLQLHYPLSVETAKTHVLVAVLYEKMRKEGEAETAYLEAIALLQQVGKRKRLANACFSLGLLYRHQARWALAETALAQAFSLHPAFNVQQLELIYRH